MSPLNMASGASISLTYIASERAIPGYGGGMSSAKAALESDTKVLAFELHLLATKHQMFHLIPTPQGAFMYSMTYSVSTCSLQRF
ncbi:enoyl-[acyl-carrier-protein] reductase [NADH] 1, chloroplastic-like [Zingiber officinale]|uniref:enoyl-[acyl-carrier-protein] reductase [NADH] 1, chloroplastic-like n=1 Tax=Zingiber officinale TaxID=94328 RepID=UPI001C4C7AAA|nr:enoyl-[acyl-carrier-protein] reductase [NADH] 1, chloroplastic-like [Zingiber officinale]XP_042412062.1 enoyl-[acyl-carrier-protein] reductase [NADH] 1, chloroplastic-like [Zingiber officinale]XP_042412063.1 enoyl-[acyl-carrier-protein] reductase [NADH] 1, chloroplastic-like [Zingiber officinale]